MITAVAGGGADDPGNGGPATEAAISHPSYVAIDAAGSVYFSDFLANRVRKVGRAGVITTVAGTGSAGFAGDGGPATAAQLSFPTGIAFDGEGNLYISDADNNVVRKVDLAGVITTVAGTGAAGFSGNGRPAAAAELDAPAGLAVGADGSLYVADQGNDRVRRVDRSGAISTVAGRGT